MNNIFQTLLYQREKQKDTVLATIVWDDGSAPRGAGSQMLVGAEGLLSGTIGGGAVELRSIQLARALLAGQHVDALYDFKLSRAGELPVLGVLQKADTEFLRAVAGHPRVRLVTVTVENRDELRRTMTL